MKRPMSTQTLRIDSPVVLDSTPLMNATSSRATLLLVLSCGAVWALASPGSASAAACMPVDGTTSWVSAVDGDWSDSAKWSNGTPSADCTAVITVAGDYTVTMNGGNAKGITLGGASGTQTLAVVGSTNAGNPHTSELIPSFGGNPFTIGTHGVLQLTSSGSNPGPAIVGGNIVSSGLIRTDAGSPGASTFRDIRANVTNNAGGTIAFHTDVSTCNCSPNHVWVNNGSFTTDAGTSATFNATGNGVSFTQSGGTFVNNGQITISGGLTHTGGDMTGNPIKVCGDLNAPGPGSASFEYPPCGGKITGDIGANDTVRLNNTGAGQLHVDSVDFTNHGTLTLDGGPGDKYLVNNHLITNAGTLNLLPGGTSIIQSRLINLGTVNIPVGAAAVFDRTIDQNGGILDDEGSLHASGAVTVAGGTLQGAGAFSADAGITNSGGTVHPGASPGILAITGNYTQTSGGTLAIDVVGTTPGSGYSQLAVSGNASLGGSLKVTTATPQVGDLRILTAKARTGEFSPVSFIGQSDAVVYDATGVTLTAAASTAPTVDLTKKPKSKVKTRKAKAKVSIKFTSEAGATFTCQVDRKAAKPCTSPFTAKLKAARGKGKKHKITILATDASGSSSAPLTVKIKVIRKGHKRS